MRNNQNTFTGLNFFQILLFAPKKCFKNCMKGKIYKRPSGIRTHGLTQCAALLHVGNTFGKEKNTK